MGLEWHGVVSVVTERNAEWLLKHTQVGLNSHYVEATNEANMEVTREWVAMRLDWPQFIEMGMSAGLASIDNRQGEVHTQMVH